VSISKIKQLFSGQKWKPRQGIVYKSWSKGDSHFGKSAVVKIIYTGEEYEDGTFSVNGEKCELRLGKSKWPNVRRLITPTENVSFKKKVQDIDTIWSGPMLGQNGYAGKEIVYTAKILDAQAVKESPIS
jgi:hypothetical protein